METIEFSDFEKTDFRAGTIVDVADFPEARKPAYQIKVDLGPELGIRQSSAQLTANYSKEELVGRQVVCLVNIKARKIASFRSEMLITGFPDAQGNVVLAQPVSQVPNGSRLF